VVSMVDVMKQFDANGNPLVGAAAATLQSVTLTVPKLQDTASTGMLASGGKG